MTTIDPATVWITTIGLVCATIATRGSFFLFFHGIKLSHRVQSSLRFIPPAIFAALVAPEFLLVEGLPRLSLVNDKLVAGAAATFVAWRTKNAFLTILVGMFVLHGVRLAG